MLRDQPGGPGPGSAIPPFVKPNRKEHTPGEKKARKKRSQAFVRKREQPTRDVLHAVEFCPDCGRKLDGGAEHHRRQVIEIPDTPVEIIDHVLIRRRCGVCNKGCLPSQGPQDSGVGLTDYSHSSARRRRGSCE